MLIAGAGWLVFISLISALVQVMTPDWARARVLAVFILTFQGGVAAGSTLWGATATRTGLSATFVVAGLATLAAAALGLLWKLPDTSVDTTPWNHWRMPAIIRDTAPLLAEGPVLVTVRYRVASAHVEGFLRAMQRYGRLRHRDGAKWWGIFRDLEHADVYLETFLVASWAEHLRQHERFTQGDREVEAQISGHIEGEPVVQHFIHAQLDS
jgi:hypothetical protein